MAFRVIIVSGPRRSGKSTLIAGMLDEICTHQPHFIRLTALHGTKQCPKGHRVSAGDCGVATATWVNYDPQRVFETLPDVLAVIHRRDRDACVVIEADADPNLRHAYPYDCSIFMMQAPEDVHEVFRTPRQTQEALQSALHDTSAFACEVYGVDGDVDGESHEPRTDMSDTQMGRFLYSPLGRELASRLQCKPEYHDMVESDIVVVNTGIGGTSLAADEAVRRIEELTHHTQSAGDHRPAVFCCDVKDGDDPRRQKLFAHLHDQYQTEN